MLTDPNDATRRNDQLLVRMRAADPKKPVLTHLAIHLPGLKVEDLPLVKPGATYEPHGLKVRVLGIVDQKAGGVSPGVGYRVTWPDGTNLLITGTELDEALVDREPPIDCVLLSAAHPRARVVGQRLQGRINVLDDVLGCARHPGPRGRPRLEDAFELQVGLRPLSSLLLAPGDSWTIQPHGD